MLFSQLPGALTLSVTLKRKSDAFWLSRVGQRHLFELCLCTHLDLIFLIANSSFFSLRDLYSQFLKEMIIQPGIAKANLGVSREDVTLEDHVSVAKPLCCREFLGDFSGSLGCSWLSSQLF